MSYKTQREEMNKQADKHKKLVITTIIVTFVAFALCLAVLWTTVLVSFVSAWISTGDIGAFFTGKEKDDEAPEIYGPFGGVVVGYVGDSPWYKQYVKVEDNIDEAPTLQIDSSEVNKDMVGRYNVYYRAKDASGNVSAVYTLIYEVKGIEYSEKTLMETIASEAKKAGITESMSKRAQVEAIYSYVQKKVDWEDGTSGIGESNIPNIDRSKWQTDWVEEAVRSLESGCGDCYSYYSLSKAFFEYFGIENEGIKRSERSSQEGTHFWQVVKIEEGWYYYDATPLAGTFTLTGDNNACLITQAKLDSHQTRDPDDINDFYKMDRPISKVSKVELD